MAEHEVMAVSLGVLRSVIAATWMNGVNAGVNEGYAAHVDTDQQTERALAVLATGVEARECALLQEVLATGPAVGDLARRMDRTREQAAGGGSDSRDGDA